jgi:quinol monooxygenase YgiN
LNDTVTIVAHWRAAPEAVDEVRQILGELARATRNEPGCRRFDVLEADRTPGQFVLFEQYAGEESRRRHLDTTHFRELVLDRAAPLLMHRDVQPYTAMQREGGRA